MKVLTATELTQGDRDNDFARCIEGELVHIILYCATARDDPDGECGCGRAFVGLSSRRPTTTALVRDVEGLTLADYAEALCSATEQGLGAELAQKVADEESEGLSRLAEGFPVGTVLERRLDRIIARTWVQP